MPISPSVLPDSLTIDPNLASAETLPAVWYTDPAAHGMERERIFRRSWQYVAPAAAVRDVGQYLSLEVAGAPVVLVRDQAGILRAFYNVCRHRAGPVAAGKGQCRILQCQYHGWSYTLEGTLVGTPEFAGVEGFDKTKHGLVPVAVAEFGAFVFINLAADAPALSSILGSIPEETAPFALGAMRLFREVRYELACNWKVYVDNYLEPYHLPKVHPGLTRELDYAAYRTEVFGQYSRQWAPVRSGESLYRRGLAAEAAPAALYYWIFPNLMLNIYPDNIQLNVIKPLSSGRTATYFAWYLRDPDSASREAEFQRSFAFSDGIQQEDIAICEQVQKGLDTPAYQRGRYSVEREIGVHHFHRLYCEAMRLGAST